VKAERPGVLACGGRSVNSLHALDRSRTSMQEVNNRLEVKHASLEQSSLLHDHQVHAEATVRCTGLAAEGVAAVRVARVRNSEF
jgi:hypothetical protein